MDRARRKVDTENAVQELVRKVSKKVTVQKTWKKRVKAVTLNSAKTSQSTLTSLVVDTPYEAKRYLRGDSMDAESIAAQAGVAATFMTQGSQKMRKGGGGTVISLTNVVEEGYEDAIDGGLRVKDVCEREWEEAECGKLEKVVEHRDARNEVEVAGEATAIPQHPAEHLETLPLPPPTPPPPEFVPTTQPILYGFNRVGEISAEFASICVAAAIILNFASTLNPSTSWSQANYQVETYDLVAVRFPLSILTNVGFAVVSLGIEKRCVGFELADCVKEARESALPFPAYAYFCFWAVSGVGPFLLAETGLFMASPTFLSGRT
ncbi:hypothetical protein HDU97_004913 [Phlyctochytrium planicorne]|nr:hypothetical protein HDU97_004913 [Phlyctochytrium planicorne]